MGDYSFQSNYSEDVENPTVNQDSYSQMTLPVAGEGTEPVPRGPSEQSSYQESQPSPQSSSQQKRKRIDEMLLGVTKDEMVRVDLNEAEIVRRQYLSHIKDAMVTIRPDGISFNNSCITKMLDTYYIHMYIDRKRKLLIIKACDEDDKDGQRWCNVKNGNRKSRKITGRPFAEKLYKMMEWSKGYYYKICGTPALQVDDEDELLFVFELKDYECYALTAKARKAAGVDDEELNQEDLQKLNEDEAARNEKRTKKKNKYPEGWDPESFGPSAAEHTSRVVIPRVEELETSKKEDFSSQRPGQ